VDLDRLRRFRRVEDATRAVEHRPRADPLGVARVRAVPVRATVEVDDPQLLTFAVADAVEEPRRIVALLEADDGAEIPARAPELPRARGRRLRDFHALGTGCARRRRRPAGGERGRDRERESENAAAGHRLNSSSRRVAWRGTMDGRGALRGSTSSR